VAETLPPASRRVFDLTILGRLALGLAKAQRFSARSVV